MKTDEEKIPLLITILLLSFFSCSCDRPKSATASTEELLPTGVRTFYDSKHNIRCYTFYGDAISCLHIIKP